MRPILALALTLPLAMPLAAQDASSAETLPAATQEGAIAAVVAQGEVPAEGEATPEVAADLAPVDRWLAEPGTIFDGSEVSLEDFRWRARPIVVFADTPFDPSFQEQMALLAEDPGPLIARDVVVITDTDPEARSAVRLDLRPRGFALVLLGKDGRVEIRKPSPWTVRELSRTIDKMPVRQQEIRDAGRIGG